MVLLGLVSPVAQAQFLDTFDTHPLPKDPEGLTGWAFFTGDGEATMILEADGQGHASIRVDATKRRRPGRRP